MLTVWVVGILGFLCGGIGAFSKEEWQMKLGELEKQLKVNAETPDYRDGMLKIYTDTVRILTPGYPAITGKGELRRNSILYDTSSQKHPVWQVTGDDIILSTPEVAIASLNFKHTYDAEEVVTGKSILMLKKVDEDAKIDLEIWNFNS